MPAQPMSRARFARYIKPSNSYMNTMQRALDRSASDAQKSASAARIATEQMPQPCREERTLLARKVTERKGR
jgi:thiaminase